MARVLVCFLAISFLVGCGKQKLTSPVEHHKTYPYGLGEGAFADDQNSPMLILREEDGVLQAAVKDWSDGRSFIFREAAAHEMTRKTAELEITYKIEGIMGSIVMRRTERRYDRATSTWSETSAVFGLPSRTAEDFTAQDIRRQKEVEAKSAAPQN